MTQLPLKEGSILTSTSPGNPTLRHRQRAQSFDQADLNALEVYETDDIVPNLLNSPQWNTLRSQQKEQSDQASVHPPSFAQSEFETIIRRQKTHPHGLKIMNIPSRFPSLDNDWEFAGWGSLRYLALDSGDIEKAKEVMGSKKITLDQFRATSIAANGVIGSVFYAFPPVALVSGIYSPISLGIACLILLFLRPVLLELGSAIRLNGANYTYLLQVSGKTLGLIGAAATLLDAMSTSTVSAATATAYLSGEFQKLPIPHVVLSLCLLACIACLALFNAKESTTLTLSFTFIHIVTMAILMVFSVIFWAKSGSSTLRANWELRPHSFRGAARAIFDGISIGFLGVSGFECAPAYLEMTTANGYASVIRNLIIAALMLNAPLMLLVYVHLPSQEILSGANVLSLLAEKVAGKWMRTLLVVDATLVLSGGIMTGLFTACGLLETLALDRVLPAAFLKRMPLTGGPYIEILFFLVACCIMYATSAFKLTVVSSVFSISMLVVLLLYTVSVLLLKFNRDRLPRKYRSSLTVIFLAFSLVLTVLIGNIALSPIAIGLFTSYFLALLAGLFIIKSRTKISKISIWLYGQTRLFQQNKLTKGLDTFFVRIIRQTRRHPISVWVQGDDIYHLMEAVLYVRRNEPTGRIIFVHAYQAIEGIPSELAPNVKILDEAFPAITLDLVFVQGKFDPVLVEAASQKMDIPRSQMFMYCPGASHEYELADYRGLRVIHH